MKKTCIVLTLIFIFAVGAMAQTVCKRHAEPEGGFSFCPPENWTPKKKDTGFTGFSAPIDGEFLGSNVNVRQTFSDMALADFVTASNKTTRDTIEKDGAIKNFKVLTRTNFVTTSNVKGEKLVYRLTFQDLPLLSMQYVLAGKDGMKLIITFTMPESYKDKLEKIIEDAAKSFQLDK